jgi:hypothetical protein
MRGKKFFLISTSYVIIHAGHVCFPINLPTALRAKKLTLDILFLASAFAKMGFMMLVLPYAKVVFK